MSLPTNNRRVCLHNNNLSVQVGGMLMLGVPLNVIIHMTTNGNNISCVYS